MISKTHACAVHFYFFIFINYFVLELPPLLGKNKQTPITTQKKQSNCQTMDKNAKVSIPIQIHEPIGTNTL